MAAKAGPKKGESNKQWNIRSKAESILGGSKPGKVSANNQKRLFNLRKQYDSFAPGKNNDMVSKESKINKSSSVTASLTNPVSSSVNAGIQSKGVNLSRTETISGETLGVNLKGTSARSYLKGEVKRGLGELAQYKANRQEGEKGKDWRQRKKQYKNESKQRSISSITLGIEKETLKGGKGNKSNYFTGYNETQLTATSKGLDNPKISDDKFKISTNSRFKHSKIYKM